MSAPSELHIYSGYRDENLQIFEGFAAPDVGPLPGFVTSFLGSRVRTRFLPPEHGVLDGQKLPARVPADFLSEAIEWIGLLRSVRDARERYRMMEVGAGFGPWCTAAAVAAQRHAIEDIRITAVEADPLRFQTLELTVADNGFLDRATLHKAAAGKTSGIGAWPPSSDPNDAGLRLLSSESAPDYRGRVYAATQEVKIIGFAELLSEHEAWDLVHIDVQGHEFEICSAAIDKMTRCVRHVVIGTHSRKLDGDIFDLFWRAGWALENEKPSRIDFRPGLPTLEIMTTHDGTQVWRNDRAPGR